jgi:hypothetical protein
MPDIPFKNIKLLVLQCWGFWQKATYMNAYVFILFRLQGLLIDY